ncbi:MAG: copper chaperone PCu(A)C [Proteobacteria bacterium]|nr:copper chaperone PCu(A)C [Pseudomonadota bacterium]MDA1357332.1 copper chaperone PCu(A)C [Pseudomonadota bacterium]
MRLAVAALAIVLLFGFAAPAIAGGIQVEDAWARASLGTERPSVAYMTIRNGGHESDHLIGAKTPVAKRASVHESLLRDGVMKMRPAENIEIAPGSAVELEPGGLHLMLSFLQKKLVEGDAFPLTLTFEHAGDVRVHVVVAGMGAKQVPQHPHERHDDDKHDAHDDHQNHHNPQE